MSSLLLPAVKRGIILPPFSPFLPYQVVVRVKEGKDIFLPRFLQHSVDASPLSRERIRHPSSPPEIEQDDVVSTLNRQNNFCPLPLSSRRVKLPPPARTEAEVIVHHALCALERPRRPVRAPAPPLRSSCWLMRPLLFPSRTTETSTFPLRRVSFLSCNRISQT